MASIFTRIINRELPAYIVAEDDRFIAFLDVMPLVQGHTLVVPKTEVDYIFNLDANMLADLMVFAQRVAKAVEKSIPCKRIGVAVIGLEVPHTHVHLVPLNTMNDINFTMPKLKLPAETMQAIADRIKANLQS
ncbi:MAG: HIT family protein [Cyclobacteriaceae bacterium]|nr:HIT family protein [Cyclobacteriaceae bacterium]